MLVWALYGGGIFFLPVMIMCPFFAYASKSSMKDSFTAVTRIQALCFLISLGLYLLSGYAPDIMPFKPEHLSRVTFQVSVMFPTSCILGFVKARPTRLLEVLSLLLGNVILALIFTGLGLLMGMVPLP